MKKDKVVYEIEDIEIGDTVNYNYDGNKDTGVVTRIITNDYGDVQIWAIWEKDLSELYCLLEHIVDVQNSKSNSNKTNVIFCCY